MRKKIGIGVFAALLILIGIPLAAKADPERENSNIKSYGSIIYKDSSGSIELYAEDIALLQEKLASVPDEIFDPILYSHMHEWKYININRTTHTRHCDGCGSAYDIVSEHEAAVSKICTIMYDGQEYPGYERICRCGYIWKEEMYHNLIYSPADATYHTLSCALNGTDYCRGLVAKDSEHAGTVYPADKTHHQPICDYCGFVGEIRECVFDYESIEDDENPDLVRKYCECWNYITEPKETVSGNSVGDEFDEESLLRGSDPVQTISENHVEAMQEGGER